MLDTNKTKHCYDRLDTNKIKYYYGTCEKNFKERYNNPKASFRNKNN